MENNAKQTLPVLPKGQGSFSYYKDDLIMFRKVIIDNDGQKVRKSVYAKTVTDCLKKMNDLEAAATYSNGKPVYNGSLMLAANIYLGLRIGELLALSWKDIDLDNRVIHVSKTLIQALNPDYDYTNEELMKAKGIKKNILLCEIGTLYSNNIK